MIKLNIEMLSSQVHAHSQWQTLREVWIGGVYPSRFYHHLGTKAHEIFSAITEITQEDFDRLKKTLENLDVKVVVPEFGSIDLYLDEHDNLLKPPISPCDIALTLGETLYIMPQYASGVQVYQSAIDRYLADSQNIHVIDRSGDDPWAWIVFASVVRAGRDIFIDFIPTNLGSKISAYKVAEILSDRYRVHLSGTGDHNDGIFCPLKPRHIMTTHYRDTYQESFPGWEVFHLPNTTTRNIKYLGTHQKWYIPGIDHGHFNREIMAVAQQWLGNPQETVFEVNMLVIDEKNVVCGAGDERAFLYLESLGITPHVVEFKSRYFWDAGIHCVTSDIHRDGTQKDYWPDRGPNGIYDIKEWK